MSQLHQPKELLQYRDELPSSGFADNKQSAAEFAGQKVNAVGDFSLPTAKSVAKESCMFIGTGTISASDGSEIFVNGKKEENGVVVSSTSGPVILRSDGLRFIGERLGAPPA